MRARGTRVQARDAIAVNDLWVAPEYEGLLRANGLDRLDALFAQANDARLNKPGLAGWRERLCISLDDHGTMRTFFLKRYTEPPAAARRDARNSRSGARSVAGVEWEWSRQLTRAGITCAQAVAFGESLRGRRELRSAVLLAGAGGRSLEAWAKEAAGRERGFIERVAPLTARMVGALHRAGYVHRDLYLSHLFYDGDAPGREAVRLIDLQRVMRPDWFVWRWRVKDLAALNYSTPGYVSRADRLGWLMLYLAESGLGWDWRRLAYLVAGKTEAIARHDQRRRVACGD